MQLRFMIICIIIQKDKKKKYFKFSLNKNKLTVIKVIFDISQTI